MLPHAFGIHNEQYGCDGYSMRVIIVGTETTQGFTVGLTTQGSSGGVLLFDWVCAKCIAGFREKGWERFATLWGIRGEFGTTYISKPAFFKTLVYFQRAHPPFVFYFTATFISFSCCLIRARSPV